MIKQLKKYFEVSDEEKIALLLDNEQQYLQTHRELYLECLNNKPLKDRKTAQEIRDGLILYWNVYRFIIDNQ